MRAITFLLLFSTFFWGCEENVFTPKPRGFPKVKYPEKSYQSFNKNFCDFTFDYPSYARIQKDTAFFDEKPVHPCWFDVVIPAFNCRLYCSYIPIDKNHPVEKLINDAFKMTDWHNKKATYIDEKPFRKENGVKGILFEVEGPVASSLQFFVTDSLEQQHFFRAALYFNTEARPDSLAPIYAFVKKDIQRMLETFEWYP